MKKETVDSTHIPSATPSVPVADEDVVLRALVEGTVRATGSHFFKVLVENLAKAMNTYGAWVTEYIPDRNRFRVLAFWLDGEITEDFEMEIEGTPCEVVVRDVRLLHHPDRLQQLYEDPHVREIGATSYMGVPLLNSKGEVLGHMAVVDRRQMPEQPRLRATFEIFAARAAAELQRIRAESELQEREEKLRRLVDSAMDAIIELDSEFTIMRINPAAEKLFGCAEKKAAGDNFLKFLSPDSCRKLTLLAHELQTKPEGERYHWIPGNLECLQRNANGFPAEASLSCFEMRGRIYFTLILRNVNDRIEAERKIQSLSEEAEYLREEIEKLQDFGEVVGESKELLRTLRDVQQVANTDSTVLILGETGTGKELIARAIHLGSSRKAKPLIKVNCAAIPASLMESEFFGYEAGAFTGATKKREGRFELANHGTIFLDEIGELPLDLQAKLLRVLQEGEFESVGSSHTRKIDVRVIAATNRNLRDFIKEGKFREDLYYRIHVFPITVPPLRDRGEDILLLANSFAQRFAQKMGRKLNPLSPAAIMRLKSYHWPGNVRELQNVIERAVITSTDGTLNLDRALPEADRPANVPQPAAKVYTAKELEEIEKENFLRALEVTGWRIAGKDGAAQLLQLKPSTFTSRMKALGIERPKPIAT
jgi:PAS domain S-box-containing protein